MTAAIFISSCPDWHTPNVALCHTTRTQRCDWCHAAPATNHTSATCSSAAAEAAWL